VPLERPHRFFKSSLSGQHCLPGEVRSHFHHNRGQSLGFVDRADEQPDPNGQQLDFGERNLDIACDDQPLVEHTVENVYETRRSPVSLCECRRHRFGIL
jgi:hypothetical protein